MSSAEAEYVAAARCRAQVLWIKSQLADYDVLYDKVPIFCDNTSAIAISNNPVLNSRTKHIDIRYHFIRDHNLKGNTELLLVPTDVQLADIFTKPLAEPSFTKLVAELTKLSQEPEPSLILSSEKVNADDTADKSSSRTFMLPVTQPKAPTDLKPKKKKILPSSKPKSSYKVRFILLKTQVAETQHAEETVATVNAIKSLDTFESAEEQVNQPKITETKTVQDQNIQEEVKESGFESIEDPDDDAQFTFFRAEPYNFEYDHTKSTKLGDSDSGSGLFSMPNDDPVTLTGFETSETAANDSQEGTAETFNDSADMPAQSDPLGHLHEELRILNTRAD
ncbi:hypothetical protein Tco_0900726 [Tanacetum coccineum]